MILLCITLIILIIGLDFLVANAVIYIYIYINTG